MIAVYKLSAGEMYETGKKRVHKSLTISHRGGNQLDEANLTRGERGDGHVGRVLYAAALVSLAAKKNQVSLISMPAPTSIRISRDRHSKFKRRLISRHFYANPLSWVLRRAGDLAAGDRSVGSKTIVLTRFLRYWDACTEKGNGRKRKRERRKGERKAEIGHDCGSRVHFARADRALISLFSYFGPWIK